MIKSNLEKKVYLGLWLQRERVHNGREGVAQQLEGKLPDHIFIHT